MQDEKYLKLEKKLKEIIDSDLEDLIVKSTVDVILDLENKYQIVLDESYKYFILNYGNFIVQEDFYYKPIERSAWTPEDGFDPVELLYGFSGDDYDLRTVIADYRDQMTDLVIPIALSPGGNQLCIGVDESNAGKIYFWDHEHEIQTNDLSELTLVANSFIDFIDSFQEVEQ